MEQVHARSLFPVAVLCGLISVGNGIILIKSPEMVNPHNVKKLETVGNPAHPPAVVHSLVVIPAVQGIAPELACGGEPVRRTACHSHRQIVLIQLEQLRIRPGIRTVKGHIYGNVPNNLNPFFMGIVLYILPLLKKLELQILVKDNVLPQLVLISLQGSRLSQTHFLVPLDPAFAAEFVFHSHIQGIVIQPVVVLHTEGKKIPVRQDFAPFKGLPKKRKTALIYFSVINIGGMISPVTGVALFLCQPSFPDQDVQIDEIGIACKGGKGLIGGIPVAGRSQRQYLPEFLTRIS